MDLESADDSVERLLESTVDFQPTFAEFAALREKERGALRTLEWQDVSYAIVNKKDSVKILEGISGSAKTGEVVAVLGPSKSGKTRFLNAISGHVAAHAGKHSLHGTVKLGGEVASVLELKQYSGFVLRHEAVLPTATPREAIEFSAALRLPTHVSPESKSLLVNDLIKSLGLLEKENVPCKGAVARDEKTSGHWC